MNVTRRDPDWQLHYAEYLQERYLPRIPDGVVLVDLSAPSMDEQKAIPIPKEPQP